MHQIKIVIFSALLLLLLTISYFMYNILLIKTFNNKNKFTIVMAGRSTTDIWFRYWNIPPILNKISVWRNWHIPYSKYVKNDMYFEYLVIPTPHKNEQNYGKDVLNKIESRLNKEHVDLLFFKFCFIDFDDRNIQTENNMSKRFTNMKTLVQDIYGITKKSETKLLLGNALPSLEPSTLSRKLRTDFNLWLKQFTSENNDIDLMDLTTLFSDENGRLKKEYSLSLSEKDNHLNHTSFKHFLPDFYKKIHTLRELKTNK